MLCNTPNVMLLLRLSVMYNIIRYVILDVMIENHYIHIKHYIIILYTHTLML